MRSLRWALLLALGVLLPWAASFARRPVEVVYSRGIFPRIAEVLGWISGRFRLSLAQLVIAAAAVVLGWILIRAIASVTGAILSGSRIGSRIGNRIGSRSGSRSASRSTSRSGTGRRRNHRGSRIAPHRWIAAAAIGVWAFHLLWGLNYAREPVTRRLSIKPVEPAAENLSRLARRLAAEVNQTYGWAEKDDQIFARTEDGRTSTQLRIARADVGDRLGSAYELLQPAFSGRILAAPKFPWVASRIMTTIGISGFYFPYTGEASVNAMLPDVSIPFTMAHEMAHQRGAAREDEANFWAYLACRETGLAAARYSGALEAFDIVFSALWSAAPDSARVIASKALDTGPRGDRAAIRAFWQRHEGTASRVAEQVNDSYLKANAQPAGVQTYGLAVELLLGLEATGALDPDSLSR